MENILRPVLFSWRGVELKTIPLFLAIGLLCGIFVYWRQIKYDSEYDEYEAVDGFLWSLCGGYLIGRLVFVLMNLDTLGLYPLNWVNVFLYPGFNELSALVASGIIFFGWCKRHKFDAWVMMDFLAQSAFLSLAIYNLGYFAAGLGFGNATNMPWGVVFPNTLTPHHPVQLYLMVCLGAIWYLLQKLEENYRTFAWYRGKRTAAQAGFVMSVGLVGFGLVNLAMLLLRPASFFINKMAIDWMIYVLVVMLGLGIMWMRSGRKLRKKK